MKLLRFLIFGAILGWFGKNGLSQTVFTPPQLGCPAVTFPELIIPQPTVNGFRFQCYPLPTGWSISGGHVVVPPSVRLQTNGTNNGSQSLLNLFAGTNVTLTDNGSGRVTLSAAGAGGGFPSGSNLLVQTGVTNVAADSGILPSTVVKTTVNYSNPGFIASLSAAKLTNLDSTLTIGGGNLGCTTATTSQFGCIKPDGSTITISGGVITASSSGAPGTGHSFTASGSPQTISAVSHGQGTAAVAFCWSGALSGGVPTGHAVICDPQKDNAGNFVVAWGGTSVGSIQIMPGSGAGGGGGGGMVYPSMGVAVSTGSAWDTSLQTGTSSGNLLLLGGSGLPAVGGSLLTSLPSFAVLNNAANTGTAAMTLDLHSSTVANAFRVPVAAGATATANGAIKYDSTNNMYHAGQSSADALVLTSAAAFAPANGDCLNAVVSGATITIGGTGAPCGSGSGAAFSGLTTGTNTTATMVVGTGAALSAAGSGTIAATSVVGFTAGAGTLTGPSSNLTLTAGGGVLSNNTSGNAATATALASAPTICSAGQAPRGVDAGGNAVTCQTLAGSGTVTTTGTITTSALLTASAPTVIQTPNATATLDSSGNIVTPGGIETFKGLEILQGGYSGVLTGFLLTTPTAITANYAWEVPAASTAGVLVDDGNVSPSHLTIVPTSGTGNFLRASAAVTSFNTRAGSVTLTAADVNSVGSITNSTSGNAGTASALAAFPSICSSGQAPRGVDAGGNPVGCQSLAVAGVSSFNTRTGAVTLTSSDVSAVGAISNSTSGNAATSTALATTPTLCPTGQAPTGVLASGNATGCAPVGGGGASNPLLPATGGAGTVSVSGTSVSGSGSNFATLFPLCTPNCTHGEAIAVYPVAVSQAGKHITSTPLPQDFAGSSNNREPSSLVWEPDGNSISAISLGDIIVPTRGYNTQAGNASIPPEFWSIAGAIGSGSNHLQGVMPIYPNVGSRYPYPIIYCTNSSVCDFYLTTPPNTTNGSTIVVSNSPGGAWNGNYTVTDNTSGFNYAAEATIIRTTNPNALSAGFHIADGLTATISSVPIGAAPTVSIVVSGGTATATFLFGHGLTVGDTIHVSGFTGGSSGINASSATILTVGDNDFPTVATFSTGAGNGTYAQQTGVISLAYTSTPHAVWSAVSSVSSNTALTLSASSGTIAGGATYASAPDNVASFNTFISSGTDAFISTAGDYYFSNDPSNTGNGIAVNNWNNYLGVTSGVHFILTQPGHEGFKFSGGAGFVLDNWTVNSLYQALQTSPVPFLQAVSVFNANRPVIRNFTTTMNMGNLIDIENTTQPRVTGLRAFNVSDGGCLVVAAVTQPLIADGQCYNSNDFTSLFMQNNFADQAMGKAVMGNWVQVNAGALALTGPNILIDNVYLEASGVTVFQAASTTGGIKISNSRLTNGWANRPTQILGEIDINTGFDVVIDNVDIVSATSTGIKANGNVNVSVNNSRITGSRFEGIFSGGSTNISVSDTNIESPGGAGLIVFNSANLSISGLTTKNSNGTYGYPSHPTDSVLTANNTLSDFRNIRIIDNRGTALGYTAFLNDTGRTDDVVGLISDAAHPFFSQGGTAGQTYVKASGYIFPTISVSGSNQTISPISETFFVSGATASIQTITVPKAMVRQDQFCLIPTLGSSALTTTTGGNIAAAATLSPGQASCFKWDGSLFWPPVSGVSTGTFAGNVDAGGLLRAQGNITPGSGAGVEVVYSTGIGSIYAYDRSGVTFKPMTVDGTTLGLNTQTGGLITTGGNISISGGTNTVVRCTGAGTLPVGALTINSGNCSSSADTGIRVQ